MKVAPGRSSPLAAPPERVRGEWLRRVEAEYRSCAAAQHLTLWLIQLGASPDLIQAGLAIAADELAHARLSHEVYTAAGGEGATHVPEELLGLSRHTGEPLVHDVLRAGVEIFCLGETVAVPLFKELRQGATVALPKQVLTRVLRDEVRHRDFGWKLLAWLLSTPPGPELRELVLAELPAMFARLRDNYARPGDETETTIGAAERAWGLMPPATYAEVLLRTVGREYLPRFARLGIEMAAM